MRAIELGIPCAFSDRDAAQHAFAQCIWIIADDAAKDDLRPGRGAGGIGIRQIAVVHHVGDARIRGEVVAAHVEGLNDLVLTHQQHVALVFDEEVGMQRVLPRPVLFNQVIQDMAVIAVEEAQHTVSQCGQAGHRLEHGRRVGVGVEVKQTAGVCHQDVVAGGEGVGDRLGPPARWRPWPRRGCWSPRGQSSCSSRLTPVPGGRVAHRDRVAADRIGRRGLIQDRRHAIGRRVAPAGCDRRRSGLETDQGEGDIRALRGRVIEAARVGRHMTPSSGPRAGSRAGCRRSGRPSRRSGRGCARSVPRRSSCPNG